MSKFLRPEFVKDLPVGTIVEVVAPEALNHYEVRYDAPGWGKVYVFAEHLKPVQQNSLELALHLIKKWEGISLKAYLCPANVWTIGYGNTKIDGRPVKKGDVVTKQEAESMLRDHVQGVESALRKSFKPYDRLTPGQQSAILSFVYNVGLSAFLGSTMAKLLVQGKNAEAGLQFARWNKAGGKTLTGLSNRRKDEFNHYIS